MGPIKIALFRLKIDKMHILKQDRLDQNSDKLYKDKEHAR